MTKDVHRIELYGRPPLLQEFFDIMAAAGVERFALFGGAIRDADYAARHGEDRSIKDYDARVWLPAKSHAKVERTFVSRLGKATGALIREEPSLGTGRIRYCLDIEDSEMDVSVRLVPSVNSPISTVAIDRAADADIGICSVAIDPSGQAWATAEYEADRDNKTLTVYPSEDAQRIGAYTARMLKKFPDHTVVSL